MDYANLKAEVTHIHNELTFIRKENTDIHSSTSEKFKELFESRNKTQSNLAELTTTVKMLVANMDKSFATIDKKLDEITQRIYERGEK